MTVAEVSEALRTASPETWLAVVSAIAAVISFFFNRQLVARQSAMQFESLKAQIDSELMAWGEKSINALSKAAYLAQQRGLGMSSAEFLRERAACVAELSALVDKGRLHFPNAETGAGGAAKSRAYRGGRPYVLNPLVFAIFALERVNHITAAPDEDACAFFTACRREFVSELQHHLNPRRRQERMRRLGLMSDKEQAEAYEESLRLAEALEQRHPGLFAEKGDHGWAASVSRAAAGDRDRPRRDRPAAAQSPT